MDSNSLIPVETVNAIELFTGGNSLDDLLARIRQETATVVPDVSTDKALVIAIAGGSIPHVTINY